MTLRHIWKIAQRVLTALVLGAPLLPRTSVFSSANCWKEDFFYKNHLWGAFFEFLENDGQVHFFVNARFF